MTLEQENAELKAHINSLREALEFIALRSKSHYECEVCADESIAKTPTQSLAEHDKKVRAEFRLVGWHGATDLDAEYPIYTNVDYLGKNQTIDNEEK